MNGFQIDERSKTLERLRDKVARVAERKHEQDDLCRVVQQAVKIWTSPRKPGIRSQSSPTIIKSVTVTSTGLLIAAEETEKDRGVKIELTLDKNAVGTIVTLLLNADPSHPK